MTRPSEIPPDAWGAVPDRSVGAMVEDWYRRGRREGLRIGLVVAAIVFLVCAGIGAASWWSP